MTRARLVWRWRHWRAAHRYWAADLAYRRHPGPDTDAARLWAALSLSRIDHAKP
jgi:hypothetical protein